MSKKIKIITHNVLVLSAVSLFTDVASEMLYPIMPIYLKTIGFSIALLVFTLFNSSDVFLLLKIKEAGLGDISALGAYIFYNLIYAISSYPLGALADKIGMKKILVSGLILFAIVYVGMAYANSNLAFLVLFFIYGVYAAATEGIAKAWITNICHPDDTATAIGTYTAFQSIATLLASSFAGAIWFYAGASTTFLLSGIVALVVAIYISRFKS